MECKALVTREELRATDSMFLTQSGLLHEANVVDRLICELPVSKEEQLRARELVHFVRISRER